MERLDVLVGHVRGLGLGHDVLQFAVGVRIRAAFAHGDGDLTADLGEYLAALRVGFFFLVLMVDHLLCPDMEHTSQFHVYEYHNTKCTSASRKSMGISVTICVR